MTRGTLERFTIRVRRGVNIHDIEHVRADMTVFVYFSPFSRCLGSRSSPQLRVLHLAPCRNRPRHRELLRHLPRGCASLLVC